MSRGSNAIWIAFVYFVRSSCVRVNDEDDASKAAVGFDFDCTLTTNHFWKVFAVGYGMDEDIFHHRPQGFLPDAAWGNFVNWCSANNVSPHCQGCFTGQFNVGSAVAAFKNTTNNINLFNDVMRNVFFGGEERIQMMKEKLELLSQKASLSIITYGNGVVVWEALDAVPEIKKFFLEEKVHSTYGNAETVEGKKANILKDDWKPDYRYLLVDDALQKKLSHCDVKSYDVECYPDGVQCPSNQISDEQSLMKLKYQDSGLNSSNFDDIIRWATTPST